MHKLGVEEVQSLQLVRESKGIEGTPSVWRSGKKTLKPGIDLVGKIWQEWKTSMDFD